MNLLGPGRYQPGMTPLALWRHEVRRTGWAGPVTPAACAAVVLLLAALQAGNSAGDTYVARTLHGVLEMGLPLAVGVVAASLAGRDAAVELQLTVRRDYRTTLVRRLAVVLGWAALVAFAVTAGLTATGWWDRWPLAPGPLAGQLIWLAPSVCLGGLGFLLGALLASPAAAGGLVTAAWLAHQLLGIQDWPVYLFATTRGSGAGWLTNRLVLLGIGLALGLAGWLCTRTERLLRGDG